MTTNKFDAFAVTAPGLSKLCAAELRALGMRPEDVSDAGVSFRADAAQLVRANLWLRTASRVVVRLAEFRADAFSQLQKQAEKVNWSRVIATGQPVTLRVTCKKSKLIHSGAVAQRVGDAITRATGAPIVRASGPEDLDDDAPAGPPPQLIVVRFDRDTCTISADSSGELLHRRGYRQQLAKAPMRETLAAALLLAAEYTGDEPLVDPLCGSGTIAIEGALIARNIAPGIARPFSCSAWTQVGAVITDVERTKARAASRPAAHAIVASDRDAGAVTATLANAARAGVAPELTVSKRALSALEAPAGATRGLLATNPPYGARVGATEELRDLYARLGQVARAKLPGWRVALLSADRRLEGATELTLVEQLRTSNGGIPVRVLTAEIAVKAHG